MSRIILVAFVGITFFSACSSPTKDNTSVANEEIINSSPGGKDADELGRKIIKAFKDDNLADYTSCINQTDQEEIEKRFKYVKERLQSNGLSDWSKVTFSRVIYSNDKSGNLASFKIEFDYGDSYIGILGGGNFALVKEGRYYIHHPFSGGRMDRK